MGVATGIRRAGAFGSCGGELPVLAQADLEAVRQRLEDDG